MSRLKLDPIKNRTEHLYFSLEPGSSLSWQIDKYMMFINPKFKLSETLIIYEPTNTGVSFKVVLVVLGGGTDYISTHLTRT